MGRARGSLDNVPFSARRFINDLKPRAVTFQQPIALDSSALIYYLEDRPPYASLLAPLFRATEPGLAISTVTLAEVLVHTARAGSVDDVRRMRQAVLGLPGLSAMSFNHGMAARAALIRASTGLKLPDAAVIATAHAAHALAVIGNDRVWKNRDLGLPYHHLDDILAME